MYSESIAYDANTGNLSSKAGVNYTYSPTRVHAVTSLSNGNSYGYDANGNMTSRTVGGVTYTLGYDAENRLVSLTGGGVTAAYTYDGDGNRVKTVVNGVTVTYIGNYFEWSNSVGTKYYYAGSVRVGVRVGTVLDYLFSDHLGSTSITADSAGNLAGGMRYTAWGETRFSGGATPTTFRYTGQRQAEAGLYYYVARMYDPALGRFISPDTIIPKARNPQAYDRFTYALNNPILYNDPSGHCVQSDSDYEDCVNELKFIEYQYSVILDDSNGLWTRSGLKGVLGGLKALKDAMPGMDFYLLFSGVKFDVVPGSKDGLWTYGKRDIHIGELSRSDDDYIKKETVHELGHIWDDSLDDSLGQGISDRTGGKVNDKGEYNPGYTPPTPHARKSKGEDWAESLTATILPNYAQNKGWEDKRKDYVSEKLKHPLPFWVEIFSYLAQGGY